MRLGGASALAAAVFAADPVNFSRYGNHRYGFCLAAIPVLYRRQPHRLALDVLACQEDELIIEKYRSKGEQNFIWPQTTSQNIALVANAWYIAKIVRLGSIAKR